MPQVDFCPTRIARCLAASIWVILTLGAVSPVGADEPRRWTLSQANQVTGSGTIVSEARVATGFRAIVLLGSVNLVLHQGEREGIVLRADDNIVGLIETRVVERGGVPTLEIGSKNGASYSTHTAPVASVEVRTLEALSIMGSGQATGDALKTPSLRVVVAGSGRLALRELLTEDVALRVEGSGDVTLSGRSRELRAAITGSAGLSARAFEADDVTLELAGSGEARVRALKALDVSIRGSGGVTYSGEPAVKSSVLGSGRLRKE